LRVLGHQLGSPLLGLLGAVASGSVVSMVTRRPSDRSIASLDRRRSIPSCCSKLNLDRRGIAPAQALRSALGDDPAGDDHRDPVGQGPASSM
jgi:hypothetical protein